MAGKQVRSRIPGYLRHKGSGQARVRLNGKDHYLGAFGSVESRVAYGKLIAAYTAGVIPDANVESPAETPPSAATVTQPVGLSVNELCLAFLRHAKTHYVKDGKPTSEVDCIKLAMRPLIDLYGVTPANDFGPLCLKVVRERMIEYGWVRKSINTAVGRIRHIFKYGVGNELVKPETLQKLQAVEPLLAGRTAAKDNPPRTAVADAHVEAVKMLVRPMVRDLIDLQRLTGARSGELFALTTSMIDRSKAVWTADIEGHKTAHHGHRRILAFGPKAQLILTRYLQAKPDAKLFRMTRHAYSRAVTRACDELKIPRWVPHQLRHSAAAMVREMFGLEHTQATLGHASADMSEHYAKVSLTKAVEVALKIG